MTGDIPACAIDDDELNSGYRWQDNYPYMCTPVSWGDHLGPRDNHKGEALNVPMAS